MAVSYSTSMVTPQEQSFVKYTDVDCRVDFRGLRPGFRAAFGDHS
jgi:hypothetical protein